jgi:hypothetical protein
MKKSLSIILFSTLLWITGCSVDDLNDAAIMEESNVSLIEQLSKPSADKGKLPQPTIWADGIKYLGLVVPASFSPHSDSFDELYVLPGMAKFYDDVPLISDSKPGDRDYNGGRWHLNELKAGVDPVKYMMANKEDDLDPADFESTDKYFECPLRPL